MALFVDNLYSQGPIAPICQIYEHLGVWSENRWMGFETQYIEPVPRSTAYIVDLLAIANVGGVGTLAAAATIAGQLIAVAQVNAHELFHARMFVIDDIEAQLWQLTNMARFAPRGGQAGVNLWTEIYDPWLATTTFWVLGGEGDKDARVGCTNISGAVLPQARMGFFGYRYILKPETNVHANARYIPAQGT